MGFAECCSRSSRHVPSDHGIEFVATNSRLGGGIVFLGAAGTKIRGQEDSLMVGRKCRYVFLLGGVLICGAAVSVAQTETTPRSN